MTKIVNDEVEKYKTMILRKFYISSTILVFLFIAMLGAVPRAGLAEDGAAPAQPWLSYVQDVHLKDASLPIVPTITLTTRYGNGCKRTDLSIDAFIISKNISAIYDERTHQSILLDSGLMIYTVENSDVSAGLDTLLNRLSRAKKSRAQTPQTPQTPAPARSASGVSEIHIHDEGQEELGDARAEHYRIDLINDSDAGATQIDIWPSTIRTPYSQINEFFNSPSKSSKKMNASNSDVQLANTIARFVPLKLEISKENRTLAKISTRDISTDPIDPSVFQVPTGYQKLSPEEFHETEKQHAMGNPQN